MSAVKTSANVAARFVGAIGATRTIGAAEAHLNEKAAKATGTVPLPVYFKEELTLGIGDLIKAKYPTSEKRLKAWADSLRKVLNSFEVSCRKQIDLIYQEIISELQGVKDESNKEMREKQSYFEKCVTELDERKQGLRRIEDFFKQLLPG